MYELHAILLAAGGSSRLGRAKQLLEFRGESLVRRAAGQLLKLTPRVTVITGACAGEVARALDGLELDGLTPELCFNERWREGMGTSIALAMTCVEPGTRAVLIMLCDQYLLDGDDLARLLGAWRQQAGRIAAARWGDSIGPPAIFPGAYFSELARLSGDLGARRLLVEQRAGTRFVDMPHAAFDVDTAEDLARLEGLRQRD